MAEDYPCSGPESKKSDQGSGGRLPAPFRLAHSSVLPFADSSLLADIPLTGHCESQTHDTELVAPAFPVNLKSGGDATLDACGR